MKKPSIRSDFLTRERLPVEQLFRFIKKDGLLLLRKNYQEKGRGIYLKKDPSTLLALQNPKVLKRLGASPSEETWKELEASL